MRKGIIVFLYSLVLALAIYTGGGITFSGNVGSPLSQTYFGCLGFKEAGFALLAFVSAGIIFIWLVGSSRAWLLWVRPCTKRYGGKKVFWSFFAILLFCWLPYVLALAPGSVLGDSLSSISQMLEFGHPTSNHHPVFYTLVVGFFCRLGLRLGDLNVGIFLYSVAQACLMAATLSYVLKVLYDKGISCWAIALCVAYFSFMPFFPTYAVILWKDPVYSCCLLWMSILLFEKLDGQGSRAWGWKFGIICLLAALFRNNGGYVVLGTAFLCYFLARKDRKKILTAVCIALTAYALFLAGTKSVWHTTGDYKENMGIPIQQIAYTLTSGGTFDKEDSELLYRILPEEKWKSSYRPCLVDSIKWDKDFNSSVFSRNKKAFLRCWVHGLIKYPEAYGKAYLLETFGFWMPGVQNDYGYIDTYISKNNYGITYMNLFNGSEQKLRDKISGFRIYFGSGTMLFVVLLGCFGTLITNKKYSIVFLPALLNWGTIMVATPVAFSLRYVYIFALGLPFFLLLPTLIGEAPLKSELEKNERKHFA